MSRLLTMVMIVILLLAHGTSVAAAVCRHQSQSEHVAARQSLDANVSIIAHGEEAAGSMASRKSVPADGGSISWPADMLPAPIFTAPFPLTESVEPELADARALVGTSIRPLLEPPTA